jgi:hypothetical protein
MFLGVWAFPLSNTEQAYIAVLRLDGILFAFTLAFFGFFRDKIRPVEQSWSYVALVAIFYSLLISIFLAFVGLLSSRPFPGGPIISISFALGAIFLIIEFLLTTAFPQKKNKLKEKKE